MNSFKQQIHYWAHMLDDTMPKNKNLKSAPPKIKSDNDIVFVGGIPKDKALWLLKKACHDVSNFHPEYIEKAAKWSDD